MNKIVALLNQLYSKNFPPLISVPLWKLSTCTHHTIPLSNSLYI